MAEGMTRTKKIEGWLDICAQAKRDGIVEGLHLAEKIASDKSLDWRCTCGDVIKVAIRAEREKLEGEQ